MNVLFFGSRMDLISGHSRPAYELASELIQRNHAVRICSTALAPERQARHDEILSRESWLTLPETERILNSFFDYLPFSPFAGSIQEILAWADIIQCFSLWSSVLLLNAKKIQAPSVLTLNTNPFQENLETPFKRTPPGWSSQRPRTWLGGQFPHWLFLRLMSPFAQYISWTSYLESKFEKVGIPAAKVCTIPFGINPARLPPVAEKQAGPPTFFYFGLLTPTRGAEDVLDAFAQVRRTLPLARLVFADRGQHIAQDRAYVRTQRRGIRRRIEELRLEGSVKIGGFDGAILDSLSTADVVALPFRGTAGYSHPPLTVLEAMAVGLPVVTTSVGSIPEVVPSEPLSYMVEPSNPSVLAEAMLAAWNADNQSLREARRKHVLEHFRWDRAVNMIEAKYRALLG